MQLKLARINIFIFKIFSIVQQPLVGQGLLIFEASRSHSGTPHSVGFLWTSDEPEAETLPENTQHSQETDVHVSAGFEPAIPANKRPQTDTLDYAGTGIGKCFYSLFKIKDSMWCKNM
jgi:hypothetical protein